MLLKYHKVQSFFFQVWFQQIPSLPALLSLGNPSLLTVQNALNVPFALSNVPLPHALPTLLHCGEYFVFFFLRQALFLLSLLSVPDNQNNFHHNNKLCHLLLPKYDSLPYQGNSDHALPLTVHHENF